MMAIITTVFFDFGNVITTFDTERFVRQFATHTGIPRKAVKKAADGDAHGYSELFAQFERGEITPQKFFHLFTATLGCARKISYADFTKFWTDIFITENIHLEKILSLLPQQKFLLSNTNKIMHERHIAHSPIIRKHFPFKNRILSYRVGAIKPEPAIYREAFLRAKAAPEECLFVDDMPKNIAAWQSLGGHGIVYNAHIHSICELEAALLKIGAFA
jgi:HAD superfamily hydrolase (TIGR01509 family)